MILITLISFKSHTTKCLVKKSTYCIFKVKAVFFLQVVAEHWDFNIHITERTWKTRFCIVISFGIFRSHMIICLTYIEKKISIHRYMTCMDINVHTFIETRRLIYPNHRIKHMQIRAHAHTHRHVNKYIRVRHPRLSPTCRSYSGHKKLLK